MKFVKYLLLTASLIIGVSSSLAVTESEMEQARATAAKIYLRWANDGSGYLDELNPKSIADLEKKIKAQEKTNLVAFKNISVPADYATWDKTKLVAYWSETAFHAPGLNEQGKRNGARSQVKRALNKMSVSAPRPAEEVTPPVEQQTKESVAANSGQDPLATAEAEAAAKAAEMEAKAAEADSVAAQLAATEEKTVEQPEASSNTWIYVGVLVLLVIVVVMLVIYASKTMKASKQTEEAEEETKPAEPQAAPQPKPQPTPVRQESKHPQYAPKPVQPEVTPSQVPMENHNSDDSSRLREKFATMLTSKEEIIRRQDLRIAELTSEIENLEAELVTAKTLNDRLRRDNEHLQLASMRQNTPVPTADGNRETPGTAHTTQPAKQGNELKEIYLGRVNDRGIFVRADRHLNPGNTIYCLVTTDGFSGTFRVVDDPVSVNRALQSPEAWLGGGCVAKDLTYTDGHSEIYTETAGTAIFEGGTWKVTRKARIRYQ